MITFGPSLTGLRGTQVVGSLICTLVSSPQDSTRIVDSGWISNLHIFDLINLLTSSSPCTPLNNFHYIISQGVLVNKPDRWRGQLTARADTCHLIQTQSPWTWVWETGLTHSFTAFRTYKERVPLVLRVPSASTRVFFASYTRKVTRRAHSGAYTRPHRTDPGVLPSWPFMTTTFGLCHDDLAREFYWPLVQALFDCWGV
jgi:hypothetical protein